MEVRLVRPDGDVLARLPQTVVEDRGDVVIGWLAEGTPIQWWALDDGSDPRSLPPARRFEASIISARRVWEGSGVLRVLPLDACYSVLHFWDAAGAFASWYVNFETRKLRRDFGIETVDLVLDLVILPDGSHHWKDEDELEPAIEAGWLTHQQASEARAAGQEILGRFDAWLAEIGDWRSFQPDSAWALPALG